MERINGLIYEKTMEKITSGSDTSFENELG